MRSMQRFFGIVIISAILGIIPDKFRQKIVSQQALVTNCA
jgi:hypothetical protein